MAVENLQLTRTTVSRNEEVACGIRRLTFERREDFIPGQTLALTTDQAIPARYYSIASGCDESSIEILYDVVAGGTLTPRLARLQPGDAVFASEAFGRFSDDEGVSVWVAAGTGVAPFVSMARSGMSAGKTLIHGSRTLAGLYLRNYFSSALGGRYIPCCSSEAAEGVFFGRTSAWLVRECLLTADRYLLCGSSRMVVDVRDVLIAQGVPFDRIVAEIYF